MRRAPVFLFGSWWQSYTRSGWCVAVCGGPPAPTAQGMVEHPDLLVSDKELLLAKGKKRKQLHHQNHMRLRRMPNPNAELAALRRIQVSGGIASLPEMHFEAAYRLAHCNYSQGVDPRLSFTPNNIEVADHHVYRIGLVAECWEDEPDRPGGEPVIMHGFRPVVFDNRNRIAWQIKQLNTCRDADALCLNAAYRWIFKRPGIVAEELDDQVTDELLAEAAAK